MASQEEEEEEQHYAYARQLVSAVTLPMVLHSAFCLGLFEIIAKAGPGAQLSPSKIVANLSSKSPGGAVFMVDRMLRLLASHSVLTCSIVEAETEEEGGDTNSVGMSGPWLHVKLVSFPLEFRYALDDTVLEGGVPFNRVHGAHLFEYHGRDPRFNEVFNRAMMNHSAITISRRLDRSSHKGFEHLKSLVDVGGGLGTAIGRITAKYPTIKGINFDLPHVVQHAPAYSGVQHIGGDMFESVPEGDAILLKVYVKSGK